MDVSCPLNMPPSIVVKWASQACAGKLLKETLAAVEEAPKADFESEV